MTAPTRTPDAAEAMTERQLREAVVECARLLKWRVYWTWNSIHSPAGFPDLCMVRNGRIIFAELKTTKGKLSPSQEAWIEDLDMTPIHGLYIWRPSDWLSGEIERALQ